MDFDSVLTPVFKLSRDMMTGLRQSGGGITDSEARYLVDLYYTMQDQRVRINNQVKGLERDAKKQDTDPEPHEAMDWTLGQFSTLEQQVEKLLTIYTDMHDMHWFFDQTFGIGPILSAGILAHIDITKAPTVGHIWRYAGYDSTVAWPKSEDAKKWVKAHGLDVALAAQVFGRNESTLLRMATTDQKGKTINLTNDTLAKAIARRPWNAELKKLCFKIGDSFVKVSTNPKGFYGHVYRERKAYEWARNLSGGNAETALATLNAKNIGRSTDARSWYSGECSAEKARDDLAQGIAPTAANCKGAPGLAMLPPAQIDMRARRYAVKLFLSHLHECWWREEFGEEPPKPFAISILGHGHYLAPPQVKP